MRGPFAVTLIMLCAGVAAAGPREELLRRVPADSVFAVVGHGLRVKFQTLMDSPFLEHAAATPLDRKLMGSPDLGELGKALKSIEKELGVTPVWLLEELAGDAFVFAYREAGEEGQGLFLAWVRNPDRVRPVLARFNNASDVKAAVPAAHGGKVYVRRQARDGDPTFVGLNGNILTFTTDEALMRKALADPRDGDSTAAAELRRLGVADRALVFWLAPRRLDREFRAEFARLEGEELRFLKAFLPYWAALDGVAAYWDMGTTFDMGLAVRADAAKMPAGGRRLLRTASKASAFWQTVPADPLFAMAGRTDVPAIIEMAGAFLSEEALAELKASFDGVLLPSLGRRVLDRLPMQIGPDWGVSAVNPPADSPKLLPDVTVALRLEPNLLFRQRAAFALRAATAVGVFALNREAGGPRFRMETVEVGDARFQCLVAEEGFPPGLKPGYAFKDGFFLLADSPETVARFRPGAAAAAAEVPLLRISVRAWREYITGREGELAAALKKYGISDEGREGLRARVANLRPYDKIEVSQIAGDGRVEFRLRVHTAKPLK